MPKLKTKSIVSDGNIYKRKKKCMSTITNENVQSDFLKKNDNNERDNMLERNELERPLNVSESNNQEVEGIMAEANGAEGMNNNDEVEDIARDEIEEKTEELKLEEKIKTQKFDFSEQECTEFYLARRYGCLNNNDQFYAKDNNGNEIYTEDDQGKKIYAVKNIVTDDGTTQAIEYPAKLKNGEPNYIVIDGKPKYPKNLNTSEPIFPKTNTTGEEVYLKDINGKEVYTRNIYGSEKALNFYAKDEFGNEIYPKTAKGIEYSIGDMYAKTKDGDEFYPKFADGNEYYIKRSYAKTKDGIQFYPKMHNHDTENEYTIPFKYAKIDEAESEVYPKKRNGDEYYMTNPQKTAEMGAYKMIGDGFLPYYAKKANGNEFYPLKVEN